MTVEDLMKPRYRVNSPWPPSNNYQKGDVVTPDMFTGWHPKDYPVLFTEMNWWEERKESEMPEYVKRTDGSEVFERHFQYNGGGSIMVQFPEGKYGKGTVGPIGLLNVLPATLEEYEIYFKTIR